jgi:GNAT superfamily N-acetyltransferase
VVGARNATESDAAAVEALRDAARTEAAAQRGGAHFVGSEGASTPSDGTVVVGTIGDVVVGVATVSHDGTRAHLHEIVTHPDARGVGVGHAMLGRVMQLAREWGCTVLDSYALPGDRETKNFFESHAMKSRLLIVSTPL